MLKTLHIYFSVVFILWMDNLGCVTRLNKITFCLVASKGEKAKLHL